MKVVIVLNGFNGGCIHALDFVTREMAFITLRLGHPENIRTSGTRVILTYNKVSINGEDANGYGRMLPEMKIQAVHMKESVLALADYKSGRAIVDDDVNIMDIHIYDRTEKAEIYIIPRRDISSAVIDYTEEVLQ